MDGLGACAKRPKLTKTIEVKNKKKPRIVSSNFNPDDPYSQYRNTLGTRYASAAMSSIFSERYRTETWRRLWIYLADEERKLGLPITPAQVKALQSHISDIDFARVRELEKKLKHDVMSHLKAFAEKAPIAEPIMHLGATSAFITDNADAILLRDATQILLTKIRSLLELLGELMLEFRDLETTGYTHFQPAQPVTVGKRFALWAQDLIADMQELEFALARYQPLGCKGTTGTQASFYVLFKGDRKKVRALDQGVCARMGFETPVALSGQTLTRKSDTWFLQALANLGSTFSKLSYDMRLLQHLREVMEPFGEKQIGSSAMPYKQNPMLAERITGLSRFLMSLNSNSYWTHATQWLERSLDDSSNRRIVIPEAFLTADALCESAHRLLSGIVVNKKDIKAHLEVHRATFETEALMMEGTLKGGSRQELHEEIRVNALKGKFSGKNAKSKKLQYPISGFAAEQVKEFYTEVLKPFLSKRKGKANIKFDAPSI